MRNLTFDMHELAVLARVLVTTGEKVSADAQNLVEAVSSHEWVSDPWADDFLEFDQFRRAAVRDLARLDKIIGKLVGVDGVLPGLAGRLLDGYLETLFSSGRPIKECLRSVEEKAVRKVVNHRFRQLREQHILAAIATGAIRWDEPCGPDPIGVGIDERIVEFPLAFQVADFQRPGRILDAGAAMNLSYIRQAIGVPVASVIHFTQSGAKEMCSFQDDRYSYVFGDLRRTEFRDGVFDRILCISTLEHVGMDNSRYGGKDEGEINGEGGSVATGGVPVGGDGSHLDTVAEMLRILTPGGQLTITVPYGEAKSHGWYQVFDRDGVVRILEIFQGHDILEKHYYYQQGWREGGATPPPDLAATGTDVAGLWAVRVTKSAAGC